MKNKYIINIIVAIISSLITVCIVILCKKNPDVRYNDIVLMQDWESEEEKIEILNRTEVVIDTILNSVYLIGMDRLTGELVEFMPYKPKIIQAEELMDSIE